MATIGPTTTGRTITGPATTGRTLTGPTSTHLTTAGPATGLTLTGPATTDLTLTGPTTTDLTTAGPATADLTTPAFTTSDLTTSGRSVTAPTSPHQQQHPCRDQAHDRHPACPHRWGVQHQCRRRPGGERRWNESEVRRSFLTRAGSTQPAPGRGVNGGAGGGEIGCAVGCADFAPHGRTRFRRSANRRSPMPLTSRSSSTERKPPCWAR